MKRSHKYEAEMDETKKKILTLRKKLDSLAEKRKPGRTSSRRYGALWRWKLSIP